MTAARHAIVMVNPGRLRIETSDGARADVELPSRDAKTWWAAHQTAWHAIPNAAEIERVEIVNRWNVRVPVNDARQPIGPAIEPDAAHPTAKDALDPGAYLMLRLCGSVDVSRPVPTQIAAAAGAGLTAGIPVSFRSEVSES